MRKGVLAGVVVVLTTVGPGLAENQIRLKARNFTPEPGLSTAAKARIEAARRTCSSSWTGK